MKYIGRYFTKYLKKHLIVYGLEILGYNINDYFIQQRLILIIDVLIIIIATFGKLES